MQQYGNIFIRHRDTNSITMDICCCCCCCCLLRLNGGINWQLLQTYKCMAFRIYQLCQQQIDFKAADRYKRTNTHTHPPAQPLAHPLNWHYMLTFTDCLQLCFFVRFSHRCFFLFFFAVLFAVAA